MEERTDIPCPAERAIPLRMGGKTLETFYCTPRDLEDLALGWLLGCGLLGTGAPPRIRVEWASSGEPQWIEAEAGEGDVPHRTPEAAAAPRGPQRTVTLEGLARLAQAVLENAPLRRESGGVHAAALGWSGGLLVREDLARHNAVDKALGAGIRRGVEFSACVLFTTGRLSHGMVAKAAAAGVPVLASMKYPSDLGAALAARMGLSLVGMVLSPEPVVYTGGWRLGLPPGDNE